AVVDELGQPEELVPAAALGVERGVAVHAGTADNLTGRGVYQVEPHRPVPGLGAVTAPPAGDDVRGDRHVAVCRMQAQRQRAEVAQATPVLDRRHVKGHGLGCRCTGGPAVSPDNGVKVSMWAMALPSARQMPLE